MPLVNENKSIPKQAEHEHGQQETTKIHEEGDRQETTQKKEDKPDQPKPIVDEVDKKGDEQKQGYEIDEHGQQTTQFHKPDEQPKTTEHKPDEQPKTMEQKPDEQSKATKQKRDEQPDATEHEIPNKKQKTTEYKHMVYKVEHKPIKHEQLPYACKLMRYKMRNKTNQACTSEGPINKHKPDESKKYDIKFQGDLYNFVPSPRHKYDPLCYACGKHIKCSLYHCEDKERYLHPFCCKLNPMIRDLKQSYILVESSPIICKWCKIKDDNGGLSYVSTTTKDLRFHVYCFMELIKDNNDNHVVKGLKTEAFLEATLSVTNTAIDSLTGGIYSMFSFMIVPQ